MGLPTEASLLRPTEFGWPPGIHARLLISGFKALLFLMGEMEPLELSATSCLLLERGGTDDYLFGMR